MNYKRHYESLIERARKRLLSGYVEVHHVLPRCLGGPDDADNLVQLTPEEHYVAHQLLHKMHPHSSSLAYALIVMLGNPYGQRTNKLYGWVRKRHASNVSVQSKKMWNDPEYRAKHKAAMDEVRSRPGYREQFSVIHKGRVKSEQERARISAAWKRPGRKPRVFSEQARANMRVAATKRAEERRATGADKVIAEKMRATRVKNGSYAKTDEQRRKISEAQKGRVIPPEQRALISASMKAYRASTRH